MTEKNILAYFKSPEEAEGVASKLQALRAIDTSIERFSEYPGEGVQRRMNPITGDIDSLGDLTLGADFTNKSAAILAAADPSASGMSDGGEGGPSGYDILLTAVMNEAEFDKALQVVKEGGGLV